MSLFAAFDNLDVVKILGFGVIGLGLLLAILAFWLLQKEQSKSSPSAEILKSVKRFMIFSVVLCVIGVGAQLLDQSRASSDQINAVSELNSKNKKLNDEIEPKNASIATLSSVVEKQDLQRQLLKSKLRDIDLAILEKEFNELQSMLSNTDPAIRQRLQNEIKGLRSRVTEAKQILVN